MVHDRCQRLPPLPPVHVASQKLGHKLCSALPAFNTTSSLAGAGKKKTRKSLCRSQQHQESLGMVGQMATPDEISKTRGEEFICNLYPAVKRQEEAQIN